jgi:hypothetical protein
MWRLLVALSSPVGSSPDRSPELGQRDQPVLTPLAAATCHKVRPLLRRASARLYPRMRTSIRSARRLDPRTPSCVARRSSLRAVDSMEPVRCRGAPGLASVPAQGAVRAQKATQMSDSRHRTWRPLGGFPVPDLWPKPMHPERLGAAIRCTATLVDGAASGI